MPSFLTTLPPAPVAPLTGHALQLLDGVAHAADDAAHNALGAVHHVRGTDALLPQGSGARSVRGTGEQGREKWSVQSRGACITCNGLAAVRHCPPDPSQL